ELIAAMTKFQGQSTSHTAAVSQKAAAVAFEGGLKSVDIMVQAFQDRANQVIDGLSKIDAIRFQPPQGGFYCLPDFSHVIESLDGVDDDQQFADWLLNEQGIAMVPGSG